MSISRRNLYALRGRTDAPLQRLTLRRAQRLTTASLFNLGGQDMKDHAAEFCPVHPRSELQPVRIGWVRSNDSELPIRAKVVLRCPVRGCHG